MRRTSWVLVALLLGCGRRSSLRADPAKIGAEPTTVVSAAPSPTISSSPVPPSPPHVVALPACTPSPRVAWIKSPFNGISCAPTRTALAPSTITIAAGTPVRLHLRAQDTTRKVGFDGSYLAEGLPKGAKLDARSGEFSWTATASASPIEIGFAAVLASDAGPRECVTDSIIIRVLDDETTLSNLYRWKHYLLLRDADLESIPTDEQISHTWIDGESMESNAARKLEDVKAAWAARQKYQDDLLCGLLPGGGLDEQDVDGDGNIDAVFSLIKGDFSFVILRPKGSETVIGKVLGRVEQRTVDGHSLFVDESWVENMYDVAISWIDAGTVHELRLSGTASSQVKWDFSGTKLQVGVETGGVAGVTDQHEWNGTGFTKK